mgnify:CR=1 FL=1
MPEQKLTWEQFPEAIRKITILHFPSEPDRSYEWRRNIYDRRMKLAKDIMEAIKPELWKCYCDTKCGPDIDFETWYQNTYNK